MTPRAGTLAIMPRQEEHPVAETLVLRDSSDQGTNLLSLSLVRSDSYRDLELRQGLLFTRQELQELEGLKFAKRKKEKTLGLFAAKEAARGLVPELKLSTLEISPGVFRQPVLKSDLTDIPEISISHSGELAVAAATPQGNPLGVDVEVVSPTREQVIREHMTLEERDLAETLSPYFPGIFCSIWSIKESLSKALRCGLGIPFKLLELKSISLLDSHTLTCGFTNFPGFTALAVEGSGYCFSLAMPAQLDIQVPQDRVLSWLR